MQQSQIDQLAKAFFTAIERADEDALRALYAPDVQVWHNLTGHTQTREENLALLREFTSRVSERRYEVLGREFFADGFVQRHVLHGKLASGKALAAAVCLVVHVGEDGTIRRLYEYLDSRAISGVFPR
jgi:ketosteroid isomerase-like protein